jgi:3-oxoadipate enol-lactonase
MPFVEVRDLSIYYEMHGSGDRVVLINGTGADLRQNPMRGSGLLETNFEVLMFDQRGLGQTSKPDVDYTMADYADDCAALMTAVGWAKAHVIGISFGGMVAQHMALRHPDRVDKLVLACTSSGGTGGASFDLLTVHHLPRSEWAAITMPILDSRNDFSTDPPTLAPMFDVLLTVMLLPAANAADPAASMGARRQLEARVDHDVWEQLPAIAAATFVLGGRYDNQAPVANVERLASRIHGAQIAFFDGGHLFFLQDPTAWPAIITFLH